MADASAVSGQLLRTGRQRIELRSELVNAELASFETAEASSLVNKILVLKLDHLGDFLISTPALTQLREIFPDAQITLICGPWNVPTAQRLGVADEIKSFVYFPQNAQNWNGQVTEDVIDRFCEIAQGQFDIAIDLRVDEDTRPLLRHVHATLRCGIGSRRRHPYLNVILPSEFEGREVRPIGTDTMTFNPRAFYSRMPVQTAFYYETDFSFTDNHLIWGPYCLLPLGKLRAELAFQLLAPVLSWPKVNVRVEVARDDAAEVVASSRLRDMRRTVTSPLDVVFINDNPQARYEFRTSVGGQPRGSRLRFLGMRIDVLEAPPQGARFLPAELHIGESLSLLVRLVAERVRPLYSERLAEQIGAAGSKPLRVPEASTATRCIIVAPFSNSTLRNWPLDRFSRFIEALLAEMDCDVLLVGSADQADLLKSLHEGLGNNARIVNLAGQTDWSGLASIISAADLVVANNSGVAHLAAACGTPTLAIYSGSHQPQEWGPRGRSVRTLMAAVPCSPCGHDKLEACPHNHLCMTLIEPENVLHHARQMLSRAKRALTPNAEGSTAS